MNFVTATLANLAAFWVFIREFATSGKYFFLTENSPKTIKGEKIGYLTGILYLAPAALSGWNVCPWSTAGCRATCLNTAGRGGIGKTNSDGTVDNNVQRARLRRTRAFFLHRSFFLFAIACDVVRLQAEARKRGLMPAVRLNGTSDLRWHSIAPMLFRMFPEVVFYDYTKDVVKMREWLAGKLPCNYHLTFSWSETCSAATVDELLAAGGNVAVPFTGTMARIPEALGVTKWTYVVDGDASDLRFLDGHGGRIVALTAKGRAKRDASGFVVRA